MPGAIVCHHHHRCDVRRADRIEGRIERPARLRGLGDLAAFAVDAQNVHTSSVTALVGTVCIDVESDDDGLEISEIKDAFLRHRFGTHTQRASVIHDMEHAWSLRDYCSDVPFAYRRMLRAVWRRVKAHTERAELEKRLWEESIDAHGMCARGHIARLANVLQGYDETAAPAPVPRGELLQNAMARIALLPVDERRAEAERVFAELAVTASERTPWLDALSV
ncbi:MAG: hypothetical protein EBT86_10260 [Actinobacteria bacterium]|nr:hypothetical protein [Actinomycetota bacterium]